MQIKDILFYYYSYNIYDCSLTYSWNPYFYFEIFSGKLIYFKIKEKTSDLIFINKTVNE